MKHVTWQKKIHKKENYQKGEFQSGKKKNFKSKKEHLQCLIQN